MRVFSPHAQRITLVIALFVVSFVLYFAAESGSGQLEMAFLGLLASLMVVAVLIN